MTSQAKPSALAERDLCFNNVLNLYQHLRGGRAAPCKLYTYFALRDTDKCQAFHDLRLARAEVEARVAAGGRAGAAAARAVADLQPWLEAQVLRTLPWSTRAHFFCVDHPYAVQLAAPLALGAVFCAFAFGPAVAAMLAAAAGALWGTAFQFYEMSKLTVLI